VGHTQADEAGGSDEKAVVTDPMSQVTWDEIITLWRSNEFMRDTPKNANALVSLLACLVCAHDVSYSSSLVYLKR
jgi:hypothetical protein